MAKTWFKQSWKTTDRLSELSYKVNLTKSLNATVKRRTNEYSVIYFNPTENNDNSRSKFIIDSAYINYNLPHRLGRLGVENEIFRNTNNNFNNTSKDIRLNILSRCLIG